MRIQHLLFRAWRLAVSWVSCGLGIKAQNLLSILDRRLAVDIADTDLVARRDTLFRVHRDTAIFPDAHTC